MKNLYLIITCFTLLFVSCTDETIIVEEVIEEAEVGSTFDIPLFNFTNPGIGNVSVFTESFSDVLPGDVPLVFRFNTDINAFESLTRTFFLDNDVFVEYRFDFAFFAGDELDVNLILDTNDFLALNPIFTDNQNFRIVLLPSDIVNEIQEENLTLEQATQRFDLKL